jgi:hypothetical protein
LDEHEAKPDVAVERDRAELGWSNQQLRTFYLPPIWGYFSLRWLGRKGYV